MFCEKCGNQLLDNAQFCCNCGVRVSTNRVMGVFNRMITREQWLEEGGRTEAAKEIKLIKVLTYVTAPILFIMFALVAVAMYMVISHYADLYTGLKILDDNDAFLDSLRVRAVVYVILIALYGIVTILAIIFGTLGVTKLRVGFSITYFVLGEIVTLLFGSTPYNFLFAAIMAVPLAFIVVSQVNLNKKYKSFVNNLY